MGRPATIKHEGLKPWEPQEISSRHKYVVALSALGMRGFEIAELIGMSESRVSVLLRDPRLEALKRDLTGEAIRELSRDAGSIIKSHVAEAAETMASLMRGAESENVRRLASADLLDRAGHKPKETVQHQVVHIDADATEALKEALAEARKPEEELEFIQDSSGVFVERKNQIEDARPRESTERLKVRGSK